MNTKIVSISWLLWITLQWTREYKYLFEIWVSFLYDIYLEMGLLYHRIFQFLFFCRTSVVFFIMTVCTVFSFIVKEAWSSLKFLLAPKLWFYGFYAPNLGGLLEIIFCPLWYVLLNFLNSWNIFSIESKFDLKQLKIIKSWAEGFMCLIKLLMSLLDQKWAVTTN